MSLENRYVQDLYKSLLLRGQGPGPACTRAPCRGQGPGPACTQAPCRALHVEGHYVDVTITDTFGYQCYGQGCAHAGRARPALLVAAQYKTKNVQVPPGRNFY